MRFFGLKPYPGISFKAEIPFAIGMAITFGFVVKLHYEIYKRDEAYAKEHHIAGGAKEIFYKSTDNYKAMHGGDH